MKFTNVAALGLAASAVVSAKKESDYTTTLTFTGPSTTIISTSTHLTHKYGKFNKTKKSSSPKNTGTHKYGRFDKTKKSSSPKASGTHKYGRFDKTKKSSTPKNSGTHKYGRFDKTKKSSTPKNTGTHKYGRFDKTKKSSTPKASGTHKYGKFDKTKRHSKTPDVKLVQANAAPQVHYDAKQVIGLTAGSALIAGALLLL